MDLRVILRTCSESSVHFSERFIPISKPELILVCLKSLVISLHELDERHRVTLSIVDDHSAPECLRLMKEVLGLCRFKAELISLEEAGNNASMKACYRLAVACPEEEIYLVEDDYLHLRGCIPEMIESYEYFRAKLRAVNPVAEVAIMPVDNKFHYLDNAMFSSPLVMGPRRHWRVNYYSNWTMLITKKALNANWENFWKFSDYQYRLPETHEDATLVPVFRESVTLFTPIPTLAFHVASDAYVPPYSDWENAWKQVIADWGLQPHHSLSKAKAPASPLCRRAGA